MLDPLFPCRVDYLTESDVRTIAATNEYHLICLAGGRLVFKSPSERSVLPPGTVLVIGKDAPFTLILQRETALYDVVFNEVLREKLCLHCLEADALDAFFPAAGTGGPDHIRVINAPADFPRLETIFQTVRFEFAEKPPHYQSMICTRLAELFILLSRMTPGKKTEELVRETGWNLNSVIRFIQEHYTEEFSLEELAARLGLSPSYFSRLFHEKTGKPLFEFINGVRVRKACLLLKRTAMPVVEIAFAVGYNNLSFFNRYFRKIMRMSPREFRNLQ